MYICTSETMLEKELRSINDKRRWVDLLKDVEKHISCMWIRRLQQQRCVYWKETKGGVKGNQWRVRREGKLWKKGIYEVLQLKLCLYCSVFPKASIARWRIKCNGVQIKCTLLLEQCLKLLEILQLLPVASLMFWDYFINWALKYNVVERVGPLYIDRRDWIVRELMIPSLQSLIYFIENSFCEQFVL